MLNVGLNNLISLLEKNGIEIPKDKSKLNEEFIKLLFRDFDIEKLQETDVTTPDFLIKVGERRVYIESKLLEDIYVYSSEIADKIIDVIGSDNVIEISPFNVRREHKEVLIREIINNWNEERDAIEIEIDNVKYIVKKLGKRKTEMGTPPVVGFSRNDDSNLKNLFRRNRIIEQLKRSDILILTIENRFVDFLDVMDVFFGGIGILFDEKEIGYSMLTTIKLKNTPWVKIGHKLKLVVLIFPETMKSILVPNPFLTDAILLDITLKSLKSMGFSCYSTNIETEIGEL